MLVHYPGATCYFYAFTNTCEEQFAPALSEYLFCQRAITCVYY